MTLQWILLQAGGQGLYSQLFVLALIGIVFFFFIIRPQQKKLKEQKNFIEALKKGQQVITTGGIHGKVVEFKDDTVVLEVGMKSEKMTFDKTAISAENSARLQK
ncbi:MAG: preprotein translocase subunit YajC [Cyclobacteriaceae bacterium]|nr:preprotein translocase subunit YajC [Cyclobacteriaceae bacterium]MCH8515511.1 preprotein translocase subunit YajC [Cyclobacteriaceae bacterium]